MKDGADTMLIELSLAQRSGYVTSSQNTVVKIASEVILWKKGEGIKSNLHFKVKST